jgi:hypothetical protein
MDSPGTWSKRSSKKRRCPEDAVEKKSKENSSTPLKGHVTPEKDQVTRFPSSVTPKNVRRAILPRRRTKLLDFPGQ